LFAVAYVYKNLITNRTQILPTSKMEEADGKVPTVKIAKGIVDRTSVTNTYQIGEVCQILVKDNPELRGKGGCWAIVSAVDFLHESKALTLNPSTKLGRGTLNLSPLLAILGEGVGG
jgi:hypothetical protein